MYLSLAHTNIEQTVHLGTRRPSGSAPDLSVQSFHGIIRADPSPVFPGKIHVDKGFLGLSSSTFLAASNSFISFSFANYIFQLVHLLLCLPEHELP